MEIKQDGELDHFGSEFYVVETKGCKALSKVECSVGDGVGGMGESLRRALSSLKDEMGGLDWEAMMDEEKGVLYMDVAVNHCGVDSSGDELVGLWRLDWLEGSYVAGGYERGNMHHINTLGLYGGMQAEMRSERRGRTHIVFRSSYNLAYEATRRLDNQRDVFGESSVYQQDERFVWEVEQVRGIYGKVAVGVGYGVREEWRIGGQAVSSVMSGLDSSVSRIDWTWEKDGCTDCRKIFGTDVIDSAWVTDFVDEVSGVLFMVTWAGERACGVAISAVQESTTELWNFDRSCDVHAAVGAFYAWDGGWICSGGSAGTAV